jgi:hypothetical protein
MIIGKELIFEKLTIKKKRTEIDLTDGRMDKSAIEPNESIAPQGGKALRTLTVYIGTAVPQKRSANRVEGSLLRGGWLCSVRDDDGPARHGSSVSKFRVKHTNPAPSSV